MRKPLSTAVMAMAGSLARPWCPRPAGASHSGRIPFAAADFGVTELQGGNGIVRLEGLGGGSG